jgi:ATP-binding cassette subfamily G (WHITE) protein 2 (SNQ2)
MLFGTTLNSTRTQDSRRNPWHDDQYLQNGREQQESPEESGTNSPNGIDRNAGTWGERDAGHLNTRTAAEDMHVLREELATLSRTRSHGTQPDRNDGLFRTVSKKSTRQSAHRRPSTTADNARRSSVPRTEDGVGDSADEEPGDIGAAAAEKDDDFELGQFMKEGHFEKRKDGESTKKVGVIYKNLTVKGVGSTATFVRTLPNAVLGTFGPDLYHLVSGWIPALRLGRHKQTRTLIHDFSGVVKDGEMCLVLGRPGSGCSTFLKAIANNRESYAAVEGEVSYGGISAAKQKKQFRGEVNCTYLPSES